MEPPLGYAYSNSQVKMVENKGDGSRVKLKECGEHVSRKSYMTLCTEVDPKYVEVGVLLDTPHAPSGIETRYDAKSELRMPLLSALD